MAMALQSFGAAASMPTQQGSAAAGNRNDSVTREVTKLLQDFIAAVPRGDKHVFDSFFADDVIYTRSAGVTVGKADIMKNIDVRAANEPTATYEADDVTVHPYADMAVVNFRLVQHIEKETNYFRNTATFLKRDGEWQVVAWQSTRVPK
jgi:uncharacterized protein (TIGR02246 family)